VLAEHPAVVMSAVVGVPHPEWGEAVHAEVILREDAQVSEEELVAHTRTKLSGYKTPRTIRIVGGLPLSPAGKILRRPVRQPYWSDQDRTV